MVPGGLVDPLHTHVEPTAAGGKPVLKPDVSAPGVGIDAAASQSVPNWSSGYYRSMNDTSMTAPHISGATATLKQRHPDWGSSASRTR